ncbi:FCD domain-containing protein [Bradyrhizobium sp. USDA 3650]
MEKRHHDFHRALIAYCKSPRLLEIAGQLYIETQRYRLPSLIGRVAEKHARDVPKEHKGDNGCRPPPERKRAGSPSRTLSQDVRDHFDLSGLG